MIRLVVRIHSSNINELTSKVIPSFTSYIKFWNVIVRLLALSLQIITVRHKHFVTLHRMMFKYHTCPFSST